jgi:Kef-type K+ transport system membrane component KefB
VRIALDHNLLLIVTLSLTLVLSPFFSKVFRLPTTVIEMLLGAGLAYLGFISENIYFEIVAEVGFLYLMFLAGLEINLKVLMNIPTSIIQKGFLYLFLLYMLSTLAHFLLGVSAIFVLIFSLISIGVVITLTKDFPKESKWLDMSLKIGVMGELASIIALTLANGLLTYGYSFDFLKTMLFLLAALLSIGLLFYISKVLFWWFPHMKTVLMPHSDTREQDMRLSFSLFFIMISFMLWLHLELALGAFLAGLFISSYFEHKSELPEKLSSFGFGFLIPLFFIHVGSTLDLALLQNVEILYTAAMITIAMIVIRFLSAVIFVLDLGHKGAALFALSQSMPLTLLIAVATLAYHANSIDTLNYYAFIVASIVEVIVIIILINAIDSFAKKWDQHILKKGQDS